MYRIIEPEAAQWDAFVRQHPRAHVLQQAAWGDLKRAYGWQYSRVALLPATGDTIVAGAQVLYRRLPARLGSMAYLPMGPLITQDDQWTPLWGAIRKRAARHNAAFLKWEPGIYPAGGAPDFARWQFSPSPQTIQPPRTILIDVRADDDTILGRMNQGTRRKIRKSLKSDIHYYEASREQVTQFTRMMQTTGERNAFGVHTPDYYLKAYDLFVTPGDAVLLMAEHEGDTLAGIMVFALGQNAWYLYGASSNDKRNLMATYGVQWQAIQWARARGCHTYDLWGVPDEDEATLEAQFETRSDGLWGVYGFKRGWGGTVVRSAGAWDRVYNSLIYQGYRAALWLRSAENA
jgi:lipid II:glycine glycyltransferase (peptidoglycan interpeptide bridge formation enzyme)